MMLLWNLICIFQVSVSSEIQPNPSNELHLYSPFEDALKSYDYKAYKLQIPTREQLQNKTLIVTLIPSIGYPNLAIDCDEEPKLMDYYEWQAPKYYMQQISITSKERESINCTDQLFYVGVSAEVQSGFVIYAYTLSGILTLYYNIPVSGEITPNEIIMYSIVPIGNEQISLSVQVSKTQVFLKQCQSQDCVYTLEEMKNSNDTATSLRLKEPKITFVHFEENCRGCTYLIGLYSETKENYRIIAKHNETHTILREGVTDQEYVQNGFYNYYEFHIPNDTYLCQLFVSSIESVRFQLTQYNGSVTMYASTNNQYPTYDNYDLKSNTNLNYNNGSTVYIGVFGNELSFYGLYTAVHRTDQIQQKHFMKLNNGTPQQFNQDDQFSYFQIILDNEKLQNFTITLTPYSGQYVMFVKSRSAEDDEIPDSFSYRWKDNRQIYITTADQDYSNDYYITVEKISDNAGEFNIQYALAGDIDLYKIGDQIIGTVYNNKPNYYKIPMIAEDLTIIKEVYSNHDIEQIEVCISLNQSNKHPNETNADYILFGQSVTIPNNELLCQEQQSNNTIKQKSPCFIYISVSGDEELFYTISTYLNNSQVRLYESLPQTYPLLNETLFYFEQLTKEASVQIYSIEARYFEVQCWVGTKDNIIQQYKSNHKGSNFQNIIIPANQTLYNNKDYKIFIRVREKNNSQDVQDSTFTIGIYTDLIFLTSSDPVIVNLYANQYTYFRLNVKNADSVLVTVSQVGSGRVSMVASLGIDSRPDLADQQFISDIATNSLIISKENETISDDIIIGVTSGEDTEIQIAYTSGHFKFFHIYLQQPYDIYLEKGEPQYYKFWQYEASLKIIIITLHGDVYLRIKQFTDDLQQVLNDNTTILSKYIERQDEIEVPKCQNCSYVIELIAYKDNSRVTLEVIRENSPITLHNSLQWTDILKEDEHSLFQLGVYRQQYLQIHLITGEIRLLISAGKNIEHDDDVDFSQRIKNDTKIQLNKSTIDFHYYYIKTIGMSEESVYSIVPIVEDIIPQTIMPGQIRTGVLEQGKLQNYSFKSYSENNNQFFILSISSINNSIDDIEITINHTNIQPINKMTHFNRAVVYQLYDFKGIYIVQLQSLSGQIHYHLSLSDNKNIILPDDVSIYNVGQVGQYHYYEVYLEEDSQILIEAYICTGAILIQGTSNLHNLQQNLYEIQFQESSEQHVQQILNLKSGTYYFSVLIVSSGLNDQTTYYIKQQTFESSELIPYQNFKQNGTYQYYVSNSMLSLTIPNFYSLDDKIKINKVTYIFKLDHQLQDDTLQCLFDGDYFEPNDQTHPYIYLVNQDMEFPFTYFEIQLFDEEFIYLQGMAKVEILNNGEIEDLTYALSSVKLDLSSNAQSHKFTWVNWVIIIVFVLALIILSIILYKKTKFTANTDEEQQQIELNYQTFA